MIILNNSILYELINSKTLKITKRNQKIADDCNYFFSPNIGLKLFNSRVKIVNAKFIVFEYQKIDNLSLLLLLRSINDLLLKDLCFKFTELKTKEIYNFFSENENTFTIRCSLPSIKFGYNIKMFDNNDPIKFRLPNVNGVFPQILLHVKNVWKNNEKYGFNLELKQVDF